MGTSVLKEYQAYRFCTFCGAEYSKKTPAFLHCDACYKNVYITPRVGLVAILLDEQNRTCFVRRMREPGKGKLDNPGGFLDQNETIEEGICRELQEELNIIMTPGRPFFLGSCDHGYVYEGVDLAVIDAVFVCWLNEEEKQLLSVQAKDEIASLEWCDILSVDPADHWNEKLCIFLQKSIPPLYINS